PRHHAAQLGAYNLDRMFESLILQLLETRLAGGALGHPLVGKAARLNIRQQLLHLFTDALVDHLRPASQVAVLRGVRDRIAHVAAAALKDQSAAKLLHMREPELRLPFGNAGSNRGFKAALKKRRQPAAEHSLFTKKIGLGFFFESFFQDAGAAPAKS